MFFFIAVSIFSSTWFVSPAYPTLAECSRAATALVSADPGELFEPSEVSECYEGEK